MQPKQLSEIQGFSSQFRFNVDVKPSVCLDKLFHVSTDLCKRKPFCFPGTSVSPFLPLAL